MGIFDTFKNKATELVDKAGDMAGDIGDKVGDKVGDLAGKAKDQAGDLAGKAKDQAGDMGDKAGDMAGDLKDKAGDMAGNLGDKAGDLGDKAGDMAGNLTDKAGDMAGDVGDKVGDLGDQAKDQMGDGVQIYTCEAKDQGFAWALKAPEAKLTNREGRQVATHFAGPTWKASDGSAVVGEVVARADAPTGSIPWLLLRAKSHDGAGTFAAVAFVRRSLTKDGSAPAGGCDAAHRGTELRVAYSALYQFYGASR